LIYNNKKDDIIMILEKLKTKAQIIAWLRKMDVQDYTINSDLTVDVIGSVFLDRKNLTHLPIQFSTIGGNFYCQFNQLSSLEGSPHTVYGMFNCSNNLLKTLEFSPNKVNGDFRCSDNPITSFNYAPKEIKENFECENCPIDSLKGIEKINIGKKFIHSWKSDNLENKPPLYEQLNSSYKLDKLTQKMVAHIDGEALEKLKLEALISNETKTKKALKV
jgi:hypothetical protein